ncbi:ribonuclease R [Empedobacter brevis]|uniref:Ribonuclease R n=2 Tax=Empedobacter brevis TaxID=247 RepID=A0A511NKA4_9FLAO|nr:ribonuclease R [Empedobacter brevis]QES92036.1 ribonuclease R [Empedobacter brevis]GEM53242.1 ribonuclease R [Empedobacter brevis NBRC 14943 = ATCC 43319]
MPRRNFKNTRAKKDKNITKFTKSIIEILFQNPNKPLNYKQIASALKLTNRIDTELLVKNLNVLLADKKISEVERGKYKINATNDYMVGIADLTSSGSAYIMIDGLEQDVFVQKGKTRNALMGDTVRVYIYPRKHAKQSKTEGEIVEVIERNKTEFTGIFELGKNGNFGFVTMQNGNHDFFIPKERMNGAQPGEKVVVRLTNWPEGSNSPFGEITEVLGSPDDTDVEIHAILLEYDLPEKFPDEVEEEANQLDTSIDENEVARRRDMRNVTTFTIDPKDAKDFDDALSIRKLENGNWEIGVHIADVTHYVRPGSLIEQEAYKRATSVYLVDRVVPMLPEILSNVACSLRPNEDKYTFSGVFEMDDNAKIVKTWFGRTVTHSDRRFTYEEAQEIIEGKDGDFKDEILTLDRLAKTMRQKRMKYGAVNFDKVEVKFDLDQKHNPQGIFFKISKDSNKLIEEFMLLCNRKVSEFISLDKHGKENSNTYIYRVHDDPNPDKLLDLKNFIRQFGYELEIGDRKTTIQSMNKLLADVKGKPEENMVETLAMRTMAKAKYTTENIGHYGLAFDYYTHFTSPIRRYPDMMAHRLLQDYLNGKKSPIAAVYEDKTKHCSSREKIAAEAERESIKYMQVKYMEQFVGETFDAFITGVQDYGIFVEIPETRCEGLIRSRAMKADHFVFDEKNHALVGKRTRVKYQLGSPVRIKVLNADLIKKQLDFELVDA